MGKAKPLNLVEVRESLTLEKNRLNSTPQVLCQWIRPNSGISGNYLQEYRSNHKPSIAYMAKTQRWREERKEIAPESSSSKGKYLAVVFVLLLLLAGGAAGVYYYLNQPQGTPPVVSAEEVLYGYVPMESEVEEPETTETASASSERGSEASDTQSASADPTVVEADPDESVSSPPEEDFTVGSQEADFEEDYLDVQIPDGKTPSVDDTVTVENYTDISLLPEEKQIEIEHTLNQYGYDGTNLDSRDNYGLTPMMKAAMWGDALSVKILLQKGANIQARDRKGRTALMLSAWPGHFKVVELLLKHGSRVNISDKEGITPLHSACYKGNAEVVELLLKNGANLHAKSNKGLTPLDYARKRNNLDVLEILERHLDSSRPDNSPSDSTSPPAETSPDSSVDDERTDMDEQGKQSK